jgi:melibiase-like protein
MTLKVNKTGFSFYDSENNLGVKDFSFKCHINGTVSTVQYDNVGNGTSGIYTGSLEHDIVCETEFCVVNNSDALTVTHTVRNNSSVPVDISHISTGQFSEDSAVKLGDIHAYDARFCHTDNVRVEKLPKTFTDFPFVRPLPKDSVALGYGEDQPFTALYITERKYERGIVIGASSQNITLQCFKIAKADATTRESECSEFLIAHELLQAGVFTLAPSETLELDGTYFELLKNSHPQNAYDNYIDYLGTKFNFRGKDTPLQQHAFYCSWNYGRFRNQYEDKLLKTARFISNNLPNIKYFLMDDGYLQTLEIKGEPFANFLNQFYPDPEANVDKEKFPQGIRHFSDEIRKLGLCPGIWWSPQVYLDSQLALEHPEWLLYKDDGQIYKIGDFGFLDISVKPACEFIDRTLKTLIQDWGMDAIKMDFWSQQFSACEIHRSQPNYTAIQSRKILFDIIRKYLPDDGIFMTCVAVGMGNPFIAEWADTYRNSLDIGSGDWEEQIHSCEWSLPTFMHSGRKTFLLNADGLGFADVPISENIFRLTWGYITMGMLEIDGFLENLNEQEVARLRKLSDRCDQGHKCFCPDENAFTGYPLPESLYVNFPESSSTYKQGVKQSLAFFNWTDEMKVISVKRSGLGHEKHVKAVNFWTGEHETFKDEFITMILPPHLAFLYDIMI